MKHRLFITLTLLYGLIQAQPPVIDSLIDLLSEVNNDSLAVDLLSEIAWQYRKVDADSGIVYGQHALALAEKSVYEQGIANAHKRLGNLYLVQNNFNQALTHLHFSKKKYSKLDDTMGLLVSNYYIAMVYDYSDNWDSSVVYHKESLKYSIMLDDSAGIALEYSNIGDYYRRVGDYTKAYTCYDSAIIIGESIGYVDALKVAYHNCGILANTQSNYNKALKYYYKSYELELKGNNEKGIAYSLLEVGNVFLHMEDYDNAKKNIEESFAICINIADSVGVARSYKNLGLIYLKQHMLFEANQKFLDALAIFRAVELKGDIVDCLNNLGHIHIKQNQKNKAKTYFEESKELSRVIKSEPNLVVAYSGMAICYSEQNDNLAIAYANKAFLGAESLGIIEVLVESSATLMKAYERQNRLKKALHYAYLNKNFSDSLLNAKQIKQLTRMEVEFEHQQIEKELKALQEKENIAHAIAIAKQKHIKRIYFIVSIALLLLVIFVYREFLIKRRAIKIQNQKNKIISSQNKDLIQQREEILTQRDVLSKQQREINSSISYASKIQNALLPKSKIIKELLPEHFILFKPCEAVSGDFYFFEKVNGKTIIVCADCTGHGVPGGMLSMLGIAFLRDIVKSERLLSADVILNKLRERFKQALDQKGIIGEAKDGIDMSLCIFDSALNKLQYAGAHSPFYLIRNDTLEIFKGDKQPVGVHYKETLFVSHDIQLQEGDVFYLSTDGFRDQMGGAHSKRFSSKQFNDLLEAIHTEPMFKQYDSLIRALEKWRGKNEATDDVLVMGFRIS